jgi:polyketide biosynthesis enoyl-CoA hydratase PksI
MALDPKHAVDLRLEEPGIARLVLQETEGKNTFTRAFTEGLRLRLAEIEADRSIKVVVLHGYDSIFCAGGTQEELLGILEKRIRFTDLDLLFRGLLQCPVPVISAMQGHALGGGLILGLYGDFIVLAEERLYGANFMKYGFTPGMGATFIVRERFGSLLANEMLFTARSFHGGELRARGAGCPVVKKDEVIPEAFRLARELADKPREALMELKTCLAGRLLRQLPAVLEEELRMHDVTFAQPEVRSRILNQFGQ